MNGRGLERGGGAYGGGRGGGGRGVWVTHQTHCGVRLQVFIGSGPRHDERGRETVYL